MNRYYFSAVQNCVFFSLLALTTQTQGVETENPQNSFVWAREDFPVEEKNRRKWDAPIVADLDQDGWPDLLINDHGYSVQVAWNDKGSFRKPNDLFMGDLHGVSVGDFDQNGLLDIVISRGGGSGSNARNSVFFSVAKNRQIERLSEFDTPLLKMRGRTVKLFDPDRDGDLDLMNFAYPSKEKRGQSESYFYENDGNGQFVLTSQLPQSWGDGQKTLATDFNNDGNTDLLMYGHKYVRAFVGRGDFDFEEVTETFFPKKITHVTSIVEIDYDNDGDFDLYFTRGKDFGKQEQFYDASSQVWGFFAKRGAFVFPELNLGDTFQIENYQSPWPNKKIYFGESSNLYPFKGEKHSGKDVEMVSSSALGWPDVVDKKGLSVGYVGNGQWLVAGDTFSPISAVVHNVQGMKHHLSADGPTDVLLENRDGRFVDVTKKAKLTFSDHGTSVVSADFDNSGYDDLLVIPRGSLVTPIKARLWLNNGRGKFEEHSDHGMVTPELGAIGIGVQKVDYNLDGKIDVVIGHERGQWHLFKNQLVNKGNYIIIDLGVPKEKSATTLGALVEIKACGNTQLKRMGSSGAAYSRNADRYVHFGVGKCNKVNGIKVTLTDGSKRVVKARDVNAIIQVY